MTQGDDCGQTVVIEIKTLTGGVQILFSGKNEITFVVFEPGADMGSFRQIDNNWALDSLHVYYLDVRVRGQVPGSLLSWNCRRSATSGCPCVPLGAIAKVMRNEE